ncbi:methionyl-tRNA formyltransferase [Thioalkalivibrio sp. ALJ24]|uniref:methionyl-tRNA formyltransferase n=1 Tax=Thioalkalivibrio sp. ALJ24 TaxID=545276 RepID=UPI0003615968|nr:methionyl-tRNA formyltransferase [Thioalkalivibrio sp. ALJ24]
MAAADRDATAPRIVYAGTPDFAVPALRALIDAGYPPVAVYTQPDRPAGRGRKLRPGPVKQASTDAGIPVEQPESLRDPQTRARLAEWQPDLLVVAAYGLILPRAVLEIPHQGGLNIHASLLPRWRGAAPIHRAILAGDDETGVCLMQMAPGLDTGPVHACRRLPLGPRVTTGEVHDALARMGAELLVEHLPAIMSGESVPQPQDEARATYAAKLEKDEARLDWQAPTVELDRRVRAFDPWPVAWTRLPDGEVLRIHAARPLDSAAAPASEAVPGTIVAAGSDGVDVATGDGLLRLERVQLPGRRPVSAADWANTGDLVGLRLGGET